MVYLSIGKQEEATKNSGMRTVGDRIREQHRLLEEQNVQTADDFNFDNAYAEYMNDEDDGCDDDLDDEDEEEHFGLSM